MKKIGPREKIPAPYYKFSHLFWKALQEYAENSFAVKWNREISHIQAEKYARQKKLKHCLELLRATRETRLALSMRQEDGGEQKFKRLLRRAALRFSRMRKDAEFPKYFLGHLAHCEGLYWLAQSDTRDKFAHINKAEGLFLSALENPFFDGKLYAYNNLSVSWLRQGLRDNLVLEARAVQAVDCFIVCIAESEAATLGLVLTNVTTLALQLGDDCHAAILARMAEVFPDFQHSRWAAAQILEKIGENCSRILQRAHGPSNPRMAAEFRNKVMTVNPTCRMTTPKAKELVKAFRERLANPVDRLFMKTWAAQEDGYNAYWTRYRNSSKKQMPDGSLADSTANSKVDGVYTLRGWSSAVGLMEGKSGLWRGGGYFIKWRGYGLVIDPGFHFLENFHDVGFFAPQIHVILVSHNHPDHCADLAKIDDLLYELARRAGKEELNRYRLLWDKDTAAEFKPRKWRSTAHRHAPSIMCPNDNPQWDGRSDSRPFNVECFSVRHSPLDLEDKKNKVRHALGFRVSLFHEDPAKAPFVIGYTGDTRYFPHPEHDQNQEDRLEHHLSGCDLLIAHVSQPDEEEDRHRDHLKNDHLGFHGLVQLARNIIGGSRICTQPPLMLIGEFWGGLADLRVDILNAFRHQVAEMHALATSTSLCVSLPDLTVPCSICNVLTAEQNLTTGSASTPYGPLIYCCESCLSPAASLSAAKGDAS